MAGAGAGPAALSEGERRQVSVLFADLSGHTRLTEASTQKSCTS